MQLLEVELTLNDRRPVVLLGRFAAFSVTRASGLRLWMAGKWPKSKCGPLASSAKKKRGSHDAIPSREDAEVCVDSVTDVAGLTELGVCVIHGMGQRRPALVAGRASCRGRREHVQQPARVLHRILADREYGFGAVDVHMAQFVVSPGAPRIVNAG